MAVRDFIDNANNGVPTNSFKPRNCHEAVLGWFMISHYPDFSTFEFSKWTKKGWVQLQFLSRIVNPTNLDSQFTGDFIGQNLYSRVLNNRLTPNSNRIELGEIQAGDVIIFDQPRYPSHSMVVTKVDSNADGVLTSVSVRGFNNAGVFGLDVAPYMEYSKKDFNILNLEKWRDNRFMAANEAKEVYRIPYDSYAEGVVNMLGGRPV